MPHFLKHRKKFTSAQGKPLNATNMKINVSNLRKIVANPEILFDLVEDLLFNPKSAYVLMCILLPLELILNLGIVMNIKCNVIV